MVTHGNRARGRFTTYMWLIAVLVVLVVATGGYFWVAQPPKIETLAYAYPEFQTFPTPRDFDAPGMVFRVGPDGVRYDVVDLSQQIDHERGSEDIPQQRARRKFSGDVLASLLDGNLSANGAVNNSYDATLTLKGVQRDRTTDLGVDRAIGRALKDVRLRADSRYFVIRETIAATAIRYDFAADQGLSAKVDRGGKKAAQQVKFEATRSDGIGIDQTFARPMRIFYKPEELEIESSGLTGEVEVSRRPVTGTLTWRAVAPARGV